MQQKQYGGNVVSGVLREWSSATSSAALKGKDVTGSAVQPKLGDLQICI